MVVINKIWGLSTLFRGLTPDFAMIMENLCGRKAKYDWMHSNLPLCSISTHLFRSESLCFRKENLLSLIFAIKVMKLWRKRRKPSRFWTKCTIFCRICEIWTQVFVTWILNLNIWNFDQNYRDLDHNYWEFDLNIWEMDRDLCDLDQSFREFDQNIRELDNNTRFGQKFYKFFVTTRNISWRPK